MKPIGQLFGIMVEKIPGFKMPVKGLMDSEREKLAIDLLFKKALEACTNSAKREFMSKQFGVTMSDKPKVSTTAVPPAVPPPVVPTTAAKPASQSKINTYFLHKAIVKEYNEEKEKAKKAKATAIKAKAKDGATKEGGGN